MSKIYNSKKGFTLIEILVTMTIVAILMALALVSYQGARKVARDGRRKADLEQIRSALEIYRSDCKTYPANVSFGSSLTGSEVGCSGNVYMSQVPQDPFDTTRTYYYKKVSASAYSLCSFLESDQSVLYTAASGCGTCNLAAGNKCYYKTTNP